MLRYPSVKRSKSKVAKRRLSAIYVTEEDVFKKTKVEIEVLVAERYILKWKEFMCFAFIWETCLFQVVHYIDMNLQYGGIVVFLGYFIFGLTMGASIYAALLFWGSYTLRGYIEFWEMVPLLKGMTWAVSLFSIFYEFFNVSMAGLALTYIPDIFHSKIPWSNCNFEEASTSCIPASTGMEYQKKCCWKNCTEEQLANKIHFPAYEFLMYNKIKNPMNISGYTGVGELQISWLISVFCTWFLIFLLVTIGFQKFRTIISTMAFIFAFLFFIPTFLLMFVSSKFATPIIVRGRASTLSSVQFWLSILCHSFSRKVPGNYIVLGSHGPKNLKPTMHIFCIYGMKYVCFLCLTVWLSTNLQLLRVHYRIQDITCIPVNGLILMFAIIPDIITRTPLPHLVLCLYFLGLWYFGFLSALYTIIAFLESITEAIPGISGVKLYFCAILCAICFLLNMLFVTNLYLSILETWRESTFTILSTAITCIFSIGIYIYSVQKYGDDFYFIYGKPLEAFWKETLKLVTLITIFFLYIIINQSLHKSDLYTTLLIRVWCYIFVAVALTPIIFVAVFVYTKYKNKSDSILAITPSPYWGPPTKAKKQARYRFKPQRESRYNREDQKCRHNCLLYSEKLENEIALARKNRLLLATALEINVVEY